MANWRRPATAGDPRISLEEILQLLGDTIPAGNAPLPAGAQTPHEYIGDGIALHHLLALTTHPRGWLRFTSDGEGRQLYLKFKWNAGSWRGHYVMAVVQWWQIKWGLSLLCHKVDEVERGEKRPAKDQAYNWND